MAQITVRLTKEEDRILAGMLERSEYPSITEAVRGIIRSSEAQQA